MRKKHYIIPIFVPHEGCPHDCVFCNQGKITGEKKDIIEGPKNRLENKVDNKFVIKTIEEYLKTIDRENSTLEVSFFGGTFTAIDIEKQRELLEVAKRYKSKKIIDYIRLSTRPDYINEYILEHLKSYNVDIIELGVQSLDEEVLKKSGRGHTANDVECASKLIKEHNFILGHQIMIGLPGDSFEKDIYTANKSVSMKPDLCRIYPALTIRNTPMEDMYYEGDYKPYSLEKAIDICMEIYNIYINNNIKVIRIGLQPTDNIAEGKDVVAGPFHPAFRELVESKDLNNKIYNTIKNYSGDIEIIIHTNKISKLYADKKRYFNELKSKAKKNNIKVINTKEIKLNEIYVNFTDKQCKINL